MKFKFALFYTIMVLVGGALVFVVACHKQDANTGQHSPADLIANARHFFESTVLPVQASAGTLSQNPRAALPKTPIWGMAYTTKTAIGDMVVVPVAIKSNFYLKTNHGNQSFSAGLFTSLVVYKDSQGSYHAELVTKIPDDSYVADLSAGKQFSGVARIEDWQGNFIKGYHYSNGVTDRYFNSSKITRANERTNTSGLLQEYCLVTDYYSCTCEVDNGATVCSSCSLDDEESSCSSGGDGGGGGGSGTSYSYQDVYHYTGGGTGVGGTWSSATNIGLNLCNTINFATDANGNYIANFNNVAEIWYNPVQGNVAIYYPTTCITMANAPNQAAASQVFDEAYNYARGQITNGLNTGTILPANVNSKFAAYLGYYLHVAYISSTWNVYSNCSATAPVNTPVFCQPIAP